MSKIYHIQLGELQVPVKVEKTRGSSIRLLYKPENQQFILRTPGGTFSPQAEAFVLKQQNWILARLQKNQQRDKRAIRFIEDLENGLIPFLGQGYQLIRKEGSVRRVERIPEKLEIHLTLLPQDQDWKVFLRESLKLLAKGLLPQRTFELAKATDSTVNRVVIKSQKSRWGSCSDKSNVNLNWHLAFMPPPLIDYVIIHELMHLRELNHGPKFWGWVKHYYPNYKQAEKDIRTYEWMIGILD